MAKRFLGRARRLSLEEQLVRIKQRWGSTWSVTRDSGAIVATGRVRPDAISREYKVRIRFSGKYPAVTVVDPPLVQLAVGERVPHTYDNRHLCLYHPDYQEWSGDKHIADTIVPWVSEWLCFYELWLACGEWFGGGEHPKRKTPYRKGAGDWS
jgi:hypothetical protein